MSIIIFLFVLGILVLSHEFGHFIAAKKSGIRVDEFAFGFPPKLFKFKKGETEYVINLLPFGGYVKIHGEDGSDDEIKNDPRSFSSKSIAIRSWVIVAGVVFNILLAWMFTVGGYVIGAPTSVEFAPAGGKISNERIIVTEVQTDTPAEKIGMKVGDEIIGFSSTDEVVKYIASHNGSELEITYKRDGEIIRSKATPVINPEKDKGALGIAMDKIGIIKLPIHLAVLEGTKTTYENFIFIAVSLFGFLYDAIIGKASFDGVAGPVGIVRIAGSAAKMGISFVLNLISVLSINLAIINILPLPALDGGRLLFLLIEKIKGSPVNTKFSSIVHGAGLALLLLLMLAITYHDIAKLF